LSSTTNQIGAFDDFEVVVNKSWKSQRNNTGLPIADHGPAVDSGLWTTGEIPMRELRKASKRTRGTQIRGSDESSAADGEGPLKMHKFPMRKLKKQGE